MRQGVKVMHLVQGRDLRKCSHTAETRPTATEQLGVCGIEYNLTIPNISLQNTKQITTYFCFWQSMLNCLS